MALGKGITVNAKSEISGPTWLAMIRRSKHIPDYFKKQIYWKKASITTEVDKFRFPKDVIQKPWLTDWLTGFKGGWELSTHHLEITAKPKVSKSGKKLGWKIIATVVPHLSDGEYISRWVSWKLTDKWNHKDSQDKKIITLGLTHKSDTVSLKSRRGLLTVCTRIIFKVGKKTQRFRFTEVEQLEAFFHEIACHAGRITQGLPYEHTDLTVQSWEFDIKVMFGMTLGSPTATKVYNAIDKALAKKTGFLIPNRGSMGLTRNPVIDTGTLARTASLAPGTIGTGSQLA